MSCQQVCGIDYIIERVYENINELKYQQRIEKVLEKFTPSEEDVLYYNLIDDVENSMVNITYTTTIKTFYIELFNNHNDDKIETNEISLDTVEHLIRDIEGVK